MGIYKWKQYPNFMFQKVFVNIYHGSVVDLNDAIKNLMYKEFDGSWTCTECNFNTKYHTTLKNHIEAKHLRAAEGYNCQHCNKYCPTKNALKCHTYRAHNQKPSGSYSYGQV